jgi:hypothetical protein
MNHSAEVAAKASATHIHSVTSAILIAAGVHSAPLTFIRITLVKVNIVHAGNCRTSACKSKTPSPLTLNQSTRW